MLLQGLPDFDPSIAEEFGYAVAEGNTFLGVPVLESQSLLQLVLRFAFNLLVSWLVVRFCYLKRCGKKEYGLTYLIFSAAMFLLIFLMESVKLQIGLTLGLFAIFGVIRYRTETVPVREMTYLFVIITIAVINGLALNISYAELLLANILLVGLLCILEWIRNRKRTDSKVVLYDRIDLIVPEKRTELKADLEKRLGTKVVNVEVGHVDLLKDAAYVKVYYIPVEGEDDTIGSIVKSKTFTEQP